MKIRRILARHPPPHDTESLIGYLLRLSDVNGYPNLNFMLRDTCLSNNLSVIDLSHLAKSARCEGKQIRRIAFSDINNRASLLEHSVSRFQLKQAALPVCPLCVHETGFVQAHFNLSLMITCPEHRMLIERCPECESSSIYKRRALLECSCGGTLSGGVDATIPEAAIELLQVVRRKALSLPNLKVSSTGLPIADLETMSLKHLLSLIHGIGVRLISPGGSEGVAKHDKRAIVTAASVALSDWPRNFRRLIQTGKEPMTCAPKAKREARAFYGFYSRSKEQLRTYENRILNELIDYSNPHWYVEGRLTRIIVTYRQYARYFNKVQDCPSGSWDAYRSRCLALATRKDCPPTPILPMDTAPKSISSNVGEPQIEIMRSIGQAASRLGIPMPVLKSLKEFGVFHSTQLPPGYNGILESDIVAFQRKIREGAMAGHRLSSHVEDAKMIPLRRFLGKRGIDVMVKTALLSQIIMGLMPVIIMGETSLSGLLIARDTLISFLRVCSELTGGEIRARFGVVRDYQGSITTEDAARIIGCETATVAVLIKKGLLVREEARGRAKCVSGESVKHFSEAYEPLGRVACRAQTTTRALIANCDRLNIPVLRLDPFSRFAKCFVRRPHVARLLAERMSVPFRDPNMTREGRRFIKERAVRNPGYPQLPQQVSTQTRSSVQFSTLLQTNQC